MNHEKTRSALVIAMLFFYFVGAAFGLTLGWFVWSVQAFG